MQQLELSRQEIGQRGEELYRQHIRQQVETEANIGKMVIIDIDSGDFEVGDNIAIEATRQLRDRHADGRFYGIKIGYNVTASFGGGMERTTPMIANQTTPYAAIVPEVNASLHAETHIPLVRVMEEGLAKRLVKTVVEDANAEI